MKKYLVSALALATVAGVLRPRTCESFTARPMRRRRHPRQRRDRPRALTGFSFGDITPYVAIPAGNYDIGVALAGTTNPVFTLNNFAVPAAGTSPSWRLNRLADFDVQLLVDDNTLDPNNARVRFFHGALDAPEVDIVAVDGQGNAIATLATLGYRDVSAYASVAAGVYDLEVRLAGTTTTELALNGLSLNANTG